MEKLLHERLREWAKDAAPIYAAKNYYDCFDSLFESLADEIERCYIPRPRFEDGEPISIGDETVRGVVDWCEVYGTGDWALCFKNGGRIEGKRDGFIKRPTPKVYDADGVEIKVGDTVYSVSNGNSGVVCDVGDFVTEYSHGEVLFKGCDEAYKADLFTHERPVFDADGARICKGDTVWTKYGDKAIVNTIYSYDTKIVEVRIDDALIDYAPNSLTHHEPDSLESIAKYEKDEAVKYAGCIEPLNKVAARLAALVDRGA